jgi:acetolactate synthase-1/2/3 large subunit
MRAADRFIRALEELGVDTMFGLPGSQNVALFDALRVSRIRTVGATHELAASFMANGYARASGRPGVLVTIPGPGFTYALTGLAEAFLDSTPLVHILARPAGAPGRRFQLQALDQASILAPMVKRVIEVTDLARIEDRVAEAFALSVSGEPGPVVLQLPPDLGSEVGESLDVSPAEPPPPVPSIASLERRLRDARRPLLYVGQGAVGAAAELAELAEALRAPVVTTSSARGILSEDHPWVVPFDRGGTDALNQLVASCDIVLALGCKFSHNGAHGFRLKIPADRLVHADASPEVLGANYDASELVVADVPWLIRTLLDSRKADGGPVRSAWNEPDVGAWRSRAYERYRPDWEPRVRGLTPPTIQEFFAALRRVMPDDSCLVLDSGLHQMLARRYFPVRAVRGMLLPTNLQAMGFALPAAIGARFARPDRTVVALIGDGGFHMSGIELLTAVRERIRLPVIVFNDGRYGLIRKQQMSRHRHAHGTDISNPDFRGFAASVGARYIRFVEGGEAALEAAIDHHGVTLIEVALRDAGRERIKRLRRTVRDRLFGALRRGR